MEEQRQAASCGRKKRKNKGWRDVRSAGWCLEQRLFLGFLLRESAERPEASRDAAPSSPREKVAPWDLKAPLINWNYSSVSEPPRLHLCHLEAEVDPLQEKMACFSNAADAVR